MIFNLPYLSKPKKNKRQGDFDELSRRPLASSPSTYRGSPSPGPASCSTPNGKAPDRYARTVLSPQPTQPKKPKTAWCPPTQECPNWVFSLKFDKGKSGNQQYLPVKTLPVKSHPERRKKYLSSDAVAGANYASNSIANASQAMVQMMKAPLMFSRRKQKGDRSMSRPLSKVDSLYKSLEDSEEFQESFMSVDKSFVAHSCDRGTVLELFGKRSVKAALARETAQASLRESPAPESAGDAAQNHSLSPAYIVDSRGTQPAEVSSTGSSPFEVSTGSSAFGRVRPDAVSNLLDNAGSKARPQEPSTTPATSNADLVLDSKADLVLEPANDVHTCLHEHLSFREAGRLIAHSNRFRNQEATKKLFLGAADPAQVNLWFLEKKVSNFKVRKSRNKASLKSNDSETSPVGGRASTESATIHQIPETSLNDEPAWDQGTRVDLDNKLRAKAKKFSGTTKDIHDSKGDEQPDQTFDFLEDLCADAKGVGRGPSIDFSNMAEDAQEALEHHEPPSPYSEPVTPIEVNEKYWGAHQVHFCMATLQVLKSYFKMYDVDRNDTLNTHELHWVIDDMGRTPIIEQDQELLVTAIKQVDDGDDELTYNEFIKVMAFFYYGVYERIFKTAADKYSYEEDHEELVLPIAALKPVLHEIYQAGMTVNYEHIDDILSKVHRVVSAEDLADGFLTWKEFLELMKHYRRIEFHYLEKTAGFDPIRLTALEEEFRSIDLNGGGTLDIREIVILMSRSGRDITYMDAFLELFARVDADRNASLDFHEFLRLSRCYGQLVIRQGDTRVNWLGTAKVSLTFQGDESEEVLNLNGVLLPMTTGGVKDDLQRPSMLLKRTQNIVNLKTRSPSIFHGEHESSNGDSNDDCLIRQMYIEAVTRLAEDGILARQWNLTVLEIRALRESFEYADINADGMVDISEFKTLLANMGCAIATKFQDDVFRRCMETVHTGEVDFKGLISMVEAYNRKLAEEIFIHCEEHHSVKGMLPDDKLILAFYQIGQYIPRSRIDELKREAGVDLEIHDIDEATFARFMTIQRNRSLLVWRKTCGFSQAEVTHFREIFDNLVPVENKRVEKSVGDKSPSLSSSPKGEDKPQDLKDFIPLTEIVKILAHLGLDGCLDHDTLMNVLIRAEHFHQGAGDDIHFEDLLLLFRHLENRKSVQARLLERKAIEAHGLDEATVNLFRSKFNSYALHGQGVGKEKGTITRKQVQVLLVSDCGVVRSQEQRRILTEVIDETIDKNTDVLTFTEFLQILATLDATGKF